MNRRMVKSKEIQCRMQYGVQSNPIDGRTNEQTCVMKCKVWCNKPATNGRLRGAYRGTRTNRWNKSVISELDSGEEVQLWPNRKWLKREWDQVKQTKTKPTERGRREEVHEPWLKKSSPVLLLWNDSRLVYVIYIVHYWIIIHKTWEMLLYTQPEGNKQTMWYCICSLVIIDNSKQLVLNIYGTDHWETGLKQRLLDNFPLNLRSSGSGSDQMCCR